MDNQLFDPKTQRWEPSPTTGKLRIVDKPKPDTRRCKNRKGKLTYKNFSGKFPLMIPENRTKLLGLLAEGKHTPTELGKEMGCSPTGINSFIRRNREAIEAEQQRLLDKLPNIVDTTIELMDEYGDKKKRKEMDRELQKHAHTHIVKNLEAVGIYPGKAESQVVKSLTLKQGDNVQINVETVETDKLYDYIEKLLQGT